MSSRSSPFASRLLLRRGSHLLRFNASCHHRRHLSSIAASELQFGQPLHETHPHLLGPEQLTLGITALEYAQRRASLARKLPENSIALLGAADVKYRSGPVFYDFHQDTDFLYLTGFNEPEAVAVIEKTGPDSEHAFHLYVRAKSAKEERWEGARSGVDAAEDVFNADEAGDVRQIQQRLRQLCSGKKTVYTDLPGSLQPRSWLTRHLLGSERVQPDAGLAGLLEKSGATAKPLRPLMNELRVVKSWAEIENMRLAGQISGKVITEAMRDTYEWEENLAALLDYRFRIYGCESSAYVPVVAAGQNAHCIHYVRNNDVVGDNDLICVDAGGQCGSYITDITRTWPNSGRFTDAQRDLYNVVLAVQRKCVSLCRADAKTTLDKIHRIADKDLRDGLKGLGFDLPSEGLVELFPHHVGHHIGLDVHEVPGYPRSKRLVSGNCVTIEPGVYVPNSPRYPEPFRGMGIRIEDSVCVDETAPFILSTEAVKEVVDIEALRD